MRNRIERFVVLPFSSIGCVSQSSVDVATGVPPHKPKSELVPTSRIYKEEIVEEVEMEIGYPTDVKHLTHIGWDGTTTTSTNSSSSNPVKGWENLAPPEILTFSSFSLKQFELAMAGQADHGHLLVPSVSK